MVPYFFMEVECIGNTHIIHVEETGITQRTIGLMSLINKIYCFVIIIWWHIVAKGLWLPAPEIGLFLTRPSRPIVGRHL